MDPISDDVFLQRVARRLLTDRHLAEDVAQEAWLAVLRCNGEVRERRRFLTGVVRHLSVDALRARERRTAREELLARPDVAPSAAEVVQRERVREHLAASLRDLPPDYEAVLRLRYWEGLPPRTIARELGLPVETVRTRTKRALARLRERLEGEYGAENGAWSVALLPLLARAEPAPPSVLRPEGSSRLEAWLAPLAVLVPLVLLVAPFDRTRGLDSVGAHAGPRVELGPDVPAFATDDSARRAPAAATTAVAVTAVVAETGQPLAGATIAARWSGGRAETTADDAGRARLRLPAGALVELSLAPTEVTAEHVLTVTAPAADTPREEAVELAAPALRRLSGRVLDERARPVANARVLARATPAEQLAVDGSSEAPPGGGSAFGDFAAEERARAAVDAQSSGVEVAAVTDAQGRWTLAGLPASFAVEARAGSRRALFALHARGLPPGAFDAGDLTLLETADLGGVVLDESGAPVADALVRIAPWCGKVRALPGDALVLDARAETSTDASGRFRFADLPDSRWTIVADRPPLVSAWRHVEAIAAERPLELRMRTGVAAIVRVVDDTGEPVEAARVRIWREFTRGFDDPPVERPRVSDARTTDAGGRCRFEGQLAEKPLLVLVEAEGHAPVVRGPLCAPFELDVALSRARTLTGRLSLRGGEPLERGFVIVRPDVDHARLAGGFDIFADAAGLCGRAHVRADGAFSLQVPPQGADLLAFALTGNGRLALDLFPVDGGAHGLELVLDSTPTFAGRVVEATSGRPLGGVELTVQSSSLAVQHRVRTPSDGSFALRLPRADDWLVVCAEPGFAAEVVPVRFGVLDRLVELTELRALDVRVVDRHGRGVPQATLSLSDAAGDPVIANGWDGRRSSVLAVGPDGALRVEGLPAKLVRFTVAVPERAEPEVFEVDLAAGAAPDAASRRDATFVLRDLDLGIERATLGLSLVVDRACTAPHVVEGEVPGAPYEGPLRVEVTTADGRPFLTLAGTLGPGGFRPTPGGASLSFSLGEQNRLRRFSRRELATGPAAYAASAVFDDPRDPLAHLPVPARGGRVVLEVGQDGERVELDVSARGSQDRRLRRIVILPLR